MVEADVEKGVGIKPEVDRIGLRCPKNAENKI